MFQPFLKPAVSPPQDIQVGVIRVEVDAISSTGIASPPETIEAIGSGVVFGIGMSDTIFVIPFLDCGVFSVSTTVLSPTVEKLSQPRAGVINNKVTVLSPTVFSSQNQLVSSVDVNVVGITEAREGIIQNRLNIKVTVLSAVKDQIFPGVFCVGPSDIFCPGAQVSDIFSPGAQVSLVQECK